MTAAAAVFYMFAALAIVSAVMVVTRSNAVHAALYLVLTFFCVAGIYVVMAAEFLAAVQVLVYAGGVTVLYLFVIMLVPLQGRSTRPPPRHVAGSLMLAVFLAALLVSFFWDVRAAPAAASPISAAVPVGNIETMGTELFVRYLLPFEVASILLLVAMIGAVVLARKKV